MRTWAKGYAFHPFDVMTTATDFVYSRRKANDSSRDNSKGSNISAAWSPVLQETLINGVLQGRKQIDTRGASALSKTKMWALCQEVYKLIVCSGPCAPRLTHSSLAGPLKIRKQVKEEVKKEALKGWNG